MARVPLSSGLPAAKLPSPQRYAPMEDIVKGTIIGRRYRVVAPLGEGAMGAVYRAEDVETREFFAVKVLHPDLSGHPEIIARFEREAIAASRIDHPNVAHATDFGCSPDGSFYLVLEFVDGRDLRFEMRSGPMDPARATNIMRGVVAGVRAAHDKGIIHRDLKPENIMLIERDGNTDFVKLLDFGIARLESASNPQSGLQALTVAGRPLGTPEYMSPEQVLGKAVDARTDLYSLGVIFFELLSGVCPFDGNVARLLQQHLTSEPPELPKAVVAEHPDLARIVRILLAKEPGKRFQTAGELAEALSASSAAPAQRRARAEAAPPESRTMASLAMRASLARKRLVGMIAPPARRSRGLQRLGMVAVCGGAVVLLAVLVFARNRSASTATLPSLPSATAPPEPKRVEGTSQPSATAEPPKVPTPRPRPIPPESTPRHKGSSKPK